MLFDFGMFMFFIDLKKFWDFGGYCKFEGFCDVFFFLGCFENDLVFIIKLVGIYIL